MSLLHIGLSNAAVATALALIAAAVSWRGRPALAYGLWLLVLLKLVTPPLIPVTLRGPARGAEADAVEEAPEPTCPVNHGHAMWIPAPADEPPVLAATEPEVPATPAWGLEEWALGAWAAGACALWLAAGWRIVALRRLIARLPAAPPEVQARVAELATRLGLRHAPGVRLLPDAKLPPLVVAPGWRAWLLLPEGLWARLDGAGRDAVLLHELAHLRRGDHRVRWLELLAVGLYWWLPVAWWARWRLRRAEEECCDAWVVWAAPQARPAYAAALVETVAFLSGQPAALPAGACGAGPVVALKRRLTMILQGQTPRGLSRPGWAVVVLGLMLMPLLPTLAAGRPAGGEAPAKSDTGLTLERVLASKACLACHQPARQKGDPKAAMDEHSRVIKLLGELTKQRESLRKTEAALREALEKFEKAAQPKAKPAAKTPREKELEERLEKLTRELEALRREVRRGDVNFGSDRSRPVAGQKYYTSARRLSIPMQWKEGTGLKKAGLFVRRDGEKQYELVKLVEAGTKIALYEAPKDGTYAFYLFPAGDDQPRTREDPPTAHLTVVVDTKPPTAELYKPVLHAGMVELSWSARDDHLVVITLEWAKDKGGPWSPILSGASNTGKHTWAPPAAVPTKVYLRLTVVDQAGNKAIARSYEPVAVKPEG